jgi:hypothetical protein
MNHEDDSKSLDGPGARPAADDVNVDEFVAALYAGIELQYFAIRGKILWRGQRTIVPHSITGQSPAARGLRLCQSS